MEAPIIEPHELTLKECTSRAGKARWANRTQEEKSAHARLMMEARVAKYGQVRHPPKWRKPVPIEKTLENWEKEYLEGEKK